MHRATVALISRPIPNFEKLGMGLYGTLELHYLSYVETHLGQPKDTLISRDIPFS